MTNRELYKAISELREAQIDVHRTLEHYLSALLGLARRYKAEAVLSASEFYFLLTEAFTAPSISFDSDWDNRYTSLLSESRVFDDWETTIIRQIVDLREMDNAGALTNEFRYYGITSPRGASWYNFDPITYLECGMAGAFGGWEPDDASGRMLVPGNVAVFDSKGELQSVPPEEIPRPVVDMAQISWEQFIDFLECGQSYE